MPSFTSFPISLGIGPANTEFFSKFLCTERKMVKAETWWYCKQVKSYIVCIQVSEARQHSNLAGNTCKCIERQITACSQEKKSGH